MPQMAETKVGLSPCGMHFTTNNAFSRNLLAEQQMEADLFTMQRGFGSALELFFLSVAKQEDTSV
jgi:hypothetical protein